jgi:hypothetical protein
MKMILQRIRQRTERFAHHPLLSYVRDESIDPWQRLAFLPCLASFSLGFSELSREYLRDDPTDDPVQVAINAHTYEDAEHWKWFLADLNSVGFNHTVPLDQAIRFLWTAELHASRRLIYDMYRFCRDASSVQRLVVSESAEATAKVSIPLFAAASRGIETPNGKPLLFFGAVHRDVESKNEPTQKDDVAALLGELKLDDATRRHYETIVDTIFDDFAEMFDAFLVIARQTEVERLKEGLSALLGVLRGPGATRLSAAQGEQVAVARF